MPYDKREGVIYLDCFTESDKKALIGLLAVLISRNSTLSPMRAVSFSFGGEILLSDIARPSGHHKLTIHAAVSFH